MKLKNRQNESIDIKEWLPFGESIEEGTKAFIGDGDVLYIGLGDSYMSVSVCQNSSNYKLKISPVHVK